MGVPVIFATADEVVWALVRAGFAVRAADTDFVLLASRDRLVEVPVGSMLAPAQLLSILRRAGMTYPDFLEHMDDGDTHPGATGSQARPKVELPSDRWGLLDE